MARINRILMAFVLLSGPGLAQETTATLLGRVYDQSGALLVGALVRVENNETGQSRLAVTDGSGSFRLSQLAPGNYRVSVEKAGFQSVVKQNISLGVSQEIVLNFTLPLGTIAESVVIEGELPLIDVLNPALSGYVGSKEIRGLPLNGRSLDQLILLEPGALAVRGATRDFSAGKTAKVSINGMRPSSVSFLLDGTDINHVLNNKTPGSAAGLLLGVEAVREFAVLASAYSAEFGRSAGGVVNIVTRSGRKDLHLSLFEFLRNSALDAKNFFDRHDQPIPPFKRNQFGLAVDGPIVRERAFFLAGYEGLRERLSVSRVDTVPSEAARSGRFTDPASGRPVAVAPQIRPFLELYPRPNGNELGGGAAEHIAARSQPTRQDYFVARIDYELSPKDSFFARYNLDDSKSIEPEPDAVSGFAVDFSARNQYLTLEERRFISNRTINNFRFGFNRSQLWSQPISPPQAAGLVRLPGRPPDAFPVIGVIGLTNLGHSPRSRFGGAMNLFEYADTLSYLSGPFALKAGMNAKRFQMNDFDDFMYDGNFRFNNLTDFLSGRSARFQGVLPGSDSYRNYRQSMFAFFLQSEIRLKQRANLSLGLRYEFITVPTEKNGKIANLRRFSDSETTVGDPFFENPSLKNFAPRIGFALDLTGSGRTTLRSGFGIFYDQVLENIYGTVARLNPPFSNSVVINNPSFPDPFQGRGRVTISRRLDPLEFELHTPYAMHFHLTLQQQLPASASVTLSYVGSRGLHLARRGDANVALPETLPDGRLFFPRGAARRNPNFDSINLTSTDANSFYHALQIGFIRRHGGWSAQAAYTLSKAIDDASMTRRSESFNDTGDAKPYYPDRKLDRALAGFDVRHNFVFNFTYDLPFGRGRRWESPLAHLLSGWQASGIATISSGFPFTALVGFDITRSLVRDGHRPNLRPGRSANPVLGGPDRYFDVSAFELQPEGFLGTLGRNTLIGPGYATFDLALVKRVEMGESAALDFRFEAFNLFNRPNFASPNNAQFGTVVFNDSSGIPVANAARIASTVGSSRQLQFGLKLTF